MILSVSRRTDIPNYYSEWFFNRIKAGFLYVRNPMNPHQVSKITITPDVVDCIVFWTKNPEPMLARLSELSEYPFYFQFTLTGYGAEMEPGVPHKKERMILVFWQLAEQIGADRVIWRYDPILFTEKYTPEYHLHAYEQIAAALNGYTKKSVISFVDCYAKNQKKLKMLGSYLPEQRDLQKFATELAQIAKENGMEIASCAEEIDLEKCGIAHNCCIDKELMERIIGCGLSVGKDKNQRPACGCAESIEVGTYHTCKNGCLYCYANESPERVWQMCDRYDPEAPLLCGVLSEKDRVIERKVKSLREMQISFDGI